MTIWDKINLLPCSTRGMVWSATHKGFKQTRKIKNNKEGLIQ
jgi:hypothetical protein